MNYSIKHIRKLRDKVNIIVLSCILSGCAGTIITKENALKECPFFNVQCKSIKDVPSYPIQIVGKEIGSICNGNQWGC